MMPVVLWTDALVFLLTAVVVLFVLYARRKPHIRGPWKRVFSGRIAATSVVVLLAFIVIGLLDSLHFRMPLEDKGNGNETHYSVEVLSVLDVMLGPVRTQVEKTYSAPFATHLFAKETIELADGTQIRDYPRLLYGGRHLPDDGAGKWRDILQRSLLALLQALVVGAVIFYVAAILLGRRANRDSRSMLRAIIARQTTLPWRTMLTTLALLVFTVLLAVNLASAYHVFGTDKVGQDVFYQTLKLSLIHI